MDDAGNYAVKAINIEGEAKSESVLNILPAVTNIPMSNEPIILQPTGFPPEFLQLFTDQQTFINSTIKFEARLIGTQPLNVNISAKSSRNFHFSISLGVLVVERFTNQPAK